MLHAGNSIRNTKVGIRNTIIKVSSPTCPKYNPFIAKNVITIRFIPYAVLVINLKNFTMTYNLSKQKNKT